MTGDEIAKIITASGALLAAIGSLHNVWNIRRLERNTNSISERNEAIAKQLGVAEESERQRVKNT